MSDELQAGRELDALVAEKLFGWTHVGTSAAYGYPPDSTIPTEEREPAVGWPPRAYTKQVPKYSTDIAAAWQVVEKLSEKYRVCVHRRANGDVGEGDNLYEIVIWLDFWNCDPEKPLAVIRAMTAPLGICRAALKVSATPRAP